MQKTKAQKQDRMANSELDNRPLSGSCLNDSLAFPESFQICRRCPRTECAAEAGR